MRVLILFAIIACVYAAPSHIAVAPLTAVPAAREISAGDIEAADINARVKAEDEERYIADQANEQFEKNIWSGEEQKWQAINHGQTFAAKLGGATAVTGFIAGGSIAPGAQALVVARAVPGVYGNYPIAYQPGLSTYSIPNFGHVYPSVVKSVW